MRRFRADSLGLYPAQRIGGELSLNVSGTNRKNVDAAVCQFHARCLADGIHGKFRGAVNSVERYRDVPRYAGDVNDAAGPLLPHDRDHRFHAFNRPEEICFESFSAVGHIHRGHTIQDSVAGVIHPNVDVLEMMQDQSDHAINFFAMANVASQGQRLINVPDARTGSFQPARITRSSSVQSGR